MVFVLAAALGVATAFDNPTRQAFVIELVGEEHVRNAVTLNSVLVNAARAVGPAVAGILIATVGVSVCFLVNSVSYLAVIASLLMLDRSALRPSLPAPRARGQLREGLRYVASTPALAIPLAMMAVIGALAYEFQVVLPIVARETFGGGAEVYGFLTAAMGVGAVVGGLVVAGSGRTGTRAVIIASFAFGVAILLAAAAPTLPIEIVAMTIVGAASVSFLAVGNSTLQLAARPDMRGRVMSLWAVAFLGTTPIGGPIAGFVSESAGGRAGLLLGGLACILAAAVAAAGALARERHKRAPRRHLLTSPTNGETMPPGSRRQPAELRGQERARSTTSPTRYARPPIAPSWTKGVPSRPCAHSQAHETMIAVIRTRPVRAVAARSMRAQRSSRPSPRIMRIVSLRPPRTSSAAMTTKRRDRRQPRLAIAADPLRSSQTRPRKIVNTGRNQRVDPIRRLVAISCMEDLLHRSREEARERDGEREGRRVAPGLDGVDRLSRDLHLLRQITL